MKTIFILMLCVVITGCNGGMTNDEIIAETKKCEDAGLRVRTVMNGWTMNVTKIQCLPDTP